MKAGSASRPFNSATNAALLYATVSRNSRILAKSCNQMLLRRRLRSLSMLPNDPSPSVYLPQTAIARPTRTQAQKCYSTRRQLESCAEKWRLERAANFRLETGTELSCVASWLHRLSSRSWRVCVACTGSVACRPMLDRCGMTYRYHDRTYELDDVPRDARLRSSFLRF